MHPISRFALSSYATGLALFYVVLHRNQLPGMIMEWLKNPEFWVAVGFVAVIGIVLWRRVPRTVAVMLDARAAAIKAELDEAKRLREDAAKLLESYRAKANLAEQEAAAIIADAKAEADRFATESRTHLRAQIERRTQMAHEKIQMAEAQAMAEIRSAAADIATLAAEKLIAARLDETRAGNLIQQSIKELPDKLN
jgi:F-type H+-transporting ATPase subunit b